MKEFDKRCKVLFNRLKLINKNDIDNLRSLIIDYTDLRKSYLRDTPIQNTMDDDQFLFKNRTCLNKSIT